MDVGRLELTVAAVFVLKHKHGISAYRALGYRVTPIVFLSLVVALLVLLAANNPREALLGSAVVVLGLPVYQLVVRRQRLEL